MLIDWPEDLNILYMIGLHKNIVCLAHFQINHVHSDIQT